MTTDHYRRRLTAAEIQEIYRHGHWIPQTRGDTAAFMRKHYPRLNLADLLTMFRTANVVEGAACRPDVVAITFSSTTSFEVEFAPVASSPHHPEAAAHLQTLFGCHRLLKLFGQSDTAACPWPTADVSIPQEIIDTVVASPDDVNEVDPRLLFATRPTLNRKRAEYYLSDAWETTGRTAADPLAAQNRTPIVITDALGRLVIVTGHHRALAALIRGRTLRCLRGSFAPST